MVGFGNVPSVLMLATILSVNYPHNAALNYFIILLFLSHFDIGEAHTQFRRYSRNQQTALGVTTIKLEKNLEQRAMVNAWTNKMFAN